MLDTFIWRRNAICKRCIRLAFGSDSGGEDGPAIYAYRGNTLDPIALREEKSLGGFIDSKVCSTFSAM